MVNYLRWLWREDRWVVRVLGVAAATLLACASGFAVSELAVLSNVQIVHGQQSAIIHLDAGTYDISQDIGDVDFPDDSTELSITGPTGTVLVRTVQPVLSFDDSAKAFLGAWDCTPVMEFTIRHAGQYRVIIKDSHGMSGAWITEPFASVARQVFPWASGVVAALLAIASCLVASGPRWRRMRPVAAARTQTQSRL
jgi:hypothetical protein